MKKLGLLRKSGLKKNQSRNRISTLSCQRIPQKRNSFLGDAFFARCSLVMTDPLFRTRYFDAVV